MTSLKEMMGMKDFWIDILPDVMLFNSYYQYSLFQFGIILAVFHLSQNF